MKRTIIMTYMLTALLAGCVEDDFLGEIFDGGDHAIRLGSGTQAMSRGDKTGAEAAADLNNSFVVYGAKYKDAAPTTATVVFDHYNVAYQGAPNSTTSNYSGWEYVGVTPVTTAKVTGFTPVPEQLIKYWDKNFDYYDFVAYSQGKGSATFTPVTMTNAGEAVDTDTPVYSVSGTISNLTSAYIADMVHVEKEDYHRDYPVTPRFRSLNAKLRMAMYEVIPGYSVKDVKFYTSGASTSTTTPCIYAASELIPVTSGQVNVYFPYYSSDAARRNEAAYSVTADEKTQNVTFGNLQYGSREGMEKEGNLYLGRSLPTATYTTTDHSYIDVLPQTSETTLTLKCDYTLVPIDDATEEIHITGATTTIPNIYSYWMPNYAYTYVFKLTDDNLHPITFDAIMVSEGNGYQETVTELAIPSITTYQNGNAYTTNNPPAYGVFDPVRRIYVTVVTSGGGLATLNSENAWLYKVAGTTGEYVVDEASVGAAATSSTLLYEKKNDEGTEVVGTLTLEKINTGVADEYFTLEGETIPAEDSPYGTPMTVDNANFIPQSGETYVFQFKMADAIYGKASASTLATGDRYYDVTHHPSSGGSESWDIYNSYKTATGNEVINGSLHKSKPVLENPVATGNCNTLKAGETYYVKDGDNYVEYVAQGDEVVDGTTTYYKDAEGTEVTTSDCNTLPKGGKYYYQVGTGSDTYYTIYYITAEGKESVDGTYTYFANMTTEPWEISEAKTLTKDATYYTRSGSAEPYTYTPFKANGNELISEADYYSMIMDVQYMYKVIKVK